MTIKLFDFAMVCKAEETLGISAVTFYDRCTLFSVCVCVCVWANRKDRKSV